MATALIQFTQGPNTDVAGKAVLGEVDEPVTVSNGNNTGVVSWKIYLLDAPSDSATFPVASQPQILAQATNGTPTVDFTPDVAGSYRVMLEVTDGGGAVDRDIRCFGIPDHFGVVRPPYQQGPEPLPVALPGIITLDPRPTKPDEQNYGSNSRGWAGSGGDGQLDDFFKRHGDLPFRGVTTGPTFTAVDTDPPLFVVDPAALPLTFTLPASPRVGFVVRIAVLGPPGDPVTVEASGGGTVGSGSSLEIVGDTGAGFVHLGTNAWAVFSVTGNGGGSVPPLSNALYVDKDTTAVSQDGSIGSPFDTLTAAIAAAASGDTILVTPGDYSAEGALTVGKNLTIAAAIPTPVGIAGLGSFYAGVVTMGDVTVSSGFSLFLFGVNVATLDAADATVGIALDSSQVTAVTGDGGINAWNSILSLPLEGNLLVAYNSQLVGGTPTITLTGEDCSLAGCQVAGGAAVVEFTGLPGTLTVDAYTNHFLEQLQAGPGFTLTNGTKTVVAAIDPSGLSVEAPAAPLPSLGVLFTVRVEFTAGGGGADDVTIYDADAPFGFRIVDSLVLVDTSAAGTIQVRTAIAGGGSALTTALSTAVTGTVRNNDTSTKTVAAGASAFAHRTDNTCAGELILFCVRV